PLSALQISFSVLLARSFMEGVPDAILDAARCDGPSSRQAFWHVLLPICCPVSAVIIVWSFVGAWNEYLLPLLFLQKTDQQTITLVPTFFESQYTADQTKIMAASVITTIPTVLLYLGLQRFFERGLTVGAVK
ncbi:MAG: carbohydrate ABC transporter permease, partial [Actinobacteria bacterium]|nr:carbohydrate ABC transporter permease [Actinomycetota bacterium]